MMMSRRLRTRFSTALALLAAIVVAACGIDVPSAPQSPAAGAPSLSAGESEVLFGRRSDDDDSDDSRSGNLSNVRLFPCATPAFGSVTQRVGREGGRIEIGPHALIVPRGALRKSVEITASAPASPHVRVTFKPHGLRFRERATLVLSYKHCGSLGPRRPKIAYVDDLQASILEVLRSKHNTSKKSVSTSLRHFSGYAIAD
jgi:hypothetical protein